MTMQIDIFPIDFNLNKHPLVAYRLDAPNSDEAGGVYAARVRKISKLPGTWLRGQNCLVTTAQFTPTMARDLLSQLHQMALSPLQNTTTIESIANWQVTPAIIAQYVAEGILDSVYDTVSEVLKAEQAVIGRVQVSRQAQFKGLVVQGTFPALQITVRSVMSSTQSLDDYLRQHGAENAKASGLAIRCRSTSGTFDGIVGKLDELASGGISHRDRLKGYNPSDYPVAWLDSLPGDHLVVALKPHYGKTIYHYPIRALKMVASMANLHHFTDNRAEQRDIAGQLKLSPAKRHEIVQTVWQTVQDYLSQKQVFVTLSSAYSQQSHPQNFSDASEVGFKSDLRFANQIISIHQDSEMISGLKKGGIYSLTTPTVKMAIVDAISTEKHNEQRFAQLTRFRDQFGAMQVTLKRATDLLRVTEAEPAKQRVKLRQVLKEAIAAKPDIILIYLPQSDRDAHRADDPSSLYNVAKEVTIGAGIASQVVYQKTLETNFADANIIMGVLGKTGNIPYVLANPLPFADVVVGLDIGRRKMSNGGSLNMGAMSRVYLSDGHMLGYNFASGKLLEGETIPAQILENIFPPEEFGGKRVVIHRDGRFPNLELESLMQWGKNIQAEFYPVEVTKSGTPRMYRLAQDKVDQTAKQTIFYLDRQTAFIVTSPPPAFRGIARTTAQPLKIRNLSTLTLEEALLSIASLTLLHYGSVRPPRLPVSTHASDKIAGFYLRDIRPNQSKGDRPFWL